MAKFVIDSVIAEKILQVLANVESPPSVVAEAEQAEAALRAALKVPHAGWQSVPVEPTKAMLEAFFGHDRIRDDSWKVGYRAMLEAAPTTPFECGQPEKAVAQVCSIYHGGKPPAAATIEILCETSDYHALPIREGDLLYRQSQPHQQPLAADQLQAEFGKLYPKDAGLIELAKHNRDFMLESIGARHHWTAFERGARAVERAHGIKERS